MKESFNNLISESKSILILLPKDPYFDQVASALALYLSVKDKKKEVGVTCPSAMVVEFNRLVGVQNITSELGNKNMVISFNGYTASAIERISSDVSGNTLSLKVIPKPGNKPPEKEQVELSYAGVSAELVVLIGGANSKHFPALAGKDFLEPKLVHIGINEIILDDNREVMSFSKPAASISEVVYELIKPEDEPIEQDIATNLIMGMYEGSRNFSHPNVTYETFRVAAELMQAGGKQINTEKSTEVRRVLPINMQQAMMMNGVREKPAEEESDKPVDNEPEKKDDTELNPPKEWMAPPKIMKGSSES